MFLERLITNHSRLNRSQPDNEEVTNLFLMGSAKQLQIPCPFARIVLNLCFLLKRQFTSDAGTNSRTIFTVSILFTIGSGAYRCEEAELKVMTSKFASK